MFSIVIFFLTLMAFDTALFVNAGLYVVNPQQGSVCHGGKPCTIDWLDDGQSPLLSAIGVATVGLYTGKQQLVQTIEPVDVSQVHSLTFTPRPGAGPNSNTYYISFISTTFKRNDSLPYAAFSPFFKLDQMTGSFATPDPSATSSIAIPSSVEKSDRPTKGGDVLTTITVGVLSTSSTSKPTSTSTSSATTLRTSSSISPTSSGTTTTSVAVTSTSPINAPTATPSVAPSGFSTAVLPSSLVPSSSLPLSVSTSSTSASPVVSTPSSSLSGNTSGAVGAGLSKGTGFSIALAVTGLILAL